MELLLTTLVVSLIVAGMGSVHLFNTCCKAGFRRELIPIITVITFTGVLIGFVVGIYYGQHELLTTRAAHYKPVISMKVIAHEKNALGIYSSDTSYTATLDRLPILYPRLTGNFKKLSVNGDTVSLQTQYIFF